MPVLVELSSETGPSGDHQAYEVEKIMGSVLDMLPLRFLSEASTWIYNREEPPG